MYPLPVKREQRDATETDTGAGPNFLQTLTNVLQVFSGNEKQPSSLEKTEIEKNARKSREQSLELIKAEYGEENRNSTSDRDQKSGLVSEQNEAQSGNQLNEHMSACLSHSKQLVKENQTVKKKEGKVKQEKAEMKENPEMNVTKEGGAFDDNDDDEIVPVQDPKVDRSRSCPYLDTINRSLLDFDFEKLCSVSLSHINVYACLVCGKYFQGRGQKSHAYTHSVLEGHHVYLNLLTQKFYCLPDNYQIIDSSLDDIIYVLNPTFTMQNIRKLDTNLNKMSRAYDGTTYLPGIVGLNNIKANDYCNVALQALSHVSPLRNYFLQEENYKKIKRPPGDQISLITQRFGELLRKLWNPRNFKAHVSPHEMLQAVVLCSKKKFQITEQGDAIEFLSWFLNACHVALNGTKKLKSSIINRTFRGRMKIFSHKMLPQEITDTEKEKLLQTEEYQETMEDTQWLYLTCDLPPPPLYPDEQQENIIPQVPFATLLAKFNGIQEKEYKTHKDSTMKRFEITSLPPFIIMYIKRFNKNYFIEEKNPTIVNFPIKNIDFGDLMTDEARSQHKFTTYNLMANVVHDGQPGSGKGTYRVHVLHKGTGKWYELQDLHVVDILPQMIPLSESYIQIFEVNKSIPNPTYKSEEKMETGT